MRILRLFYFLVAGLGTLTSARAVLLFGGDNATNITDPGTGLPWNNVVEFHNGSGTTYGSGVYLGNQFILTAGHVDHVTGSQIEIGGQTFSIDTGFNAGGYVSGVQQVGSADLKLIRLAVDPAETVSGLTAINLNPYTADLNQNSIFVGYGQGKGSEISGQGWNWGGASTDGIKRWGSNTTTTSVYSIPNAPYTSISIESIFNSDAGADEFALAFGDSGGGLFYDISGTWYLSGIAAYVETGNMSLYDPLDPDSNYFVRVGAYRSTIEGLIAVPEPSSVQLLALGCGLLFFLIYRKKKISV